MAMMRAKRPKYGTFPIYSPSKSIKKHTREVTREDLIYALTPIPVLVKNSLNIFTIILAILIKFLLELAIQIQGLILGV